MIPWKVSGAGNTFVMEILGAQDKVPNDVQTSKFCEAHNVDGYLALVKSDIEHSVFSWSFFNRDGSEAEFCGNAARCAQYFINTHLKIEKAVQRTRSGQVKTWTENNKHWVQMPNPQIFQQKVVLKLGDKSFEGLWCDTGVPHFVICNAPETLDKKNSRELRIHPDLGPRGANITWIQGSLDGATIRATTYERGVEDFTDACGTGALAASLALQVLRPQTKEFNVQMPGGLLQINHNGSDWTMTGPVEKLGEWQGSKNG